MKKNNHFEKAREIWLRVVKSSENIPSSLDVEIHRKLLNIFHTGPYYYYIFNCFTADFDYIDTNVKKILGYSITMLSPQFIYTKIHPNDAPYVIDFEDKITQFYEKLPITELMNYKTSYDYRVMTEKNVYIRILQQVTVIQVGEDRSIYRTLGVHTDISHIKKDGAPVLHAMTLHGEKVFCYSGQNITLEDTKKVLTKRELQIVKLIAEGKQNKDIAEILYISHHTVTTHRKNIMTKTKASSAAELIKMTIDRGWL